MLAEQELEELLFHYAHLLVLRCLYLGLVQSIVSTVVSIVPPLIPPPYVLCFAFCLYTGHGIVRPSRGPMFWQSVEQHALGLRGERTVHAYETGTAQEVVERDDLDAIIPHSWRTRR